MKLRPYFVPLVCAAVALTGCNDQEPEFTPSGETGGIMLTLSLEAKGVGSFAQSRANPEKEAAVYNEGKLHDAIVVIYAHSLRGSSVTESEVPLAVAKVNLNATSETASTGVYKSDEFTVSIAEGSYYYYVIANPNAEVYDAVKNLTLDEMRSFVYTWTPYVAGATMKQADRFAMVSDQEGLFTIDTDDVESGNAVDITGSGAHVVERLAARIDVSFGNPADNIYYDINEQKITFTGAVPSAQVVKIEMPVYDYDLYKNDGSLVLTGDKFTITDIDVLKVAAPNMYAIQRNGNAVGNLFSGEVWQASGYSKYTVRQPGDLVLTDMVNEYTLASVFTANNNLYTDGVNPFYTLGYFSENIAGAGGAATNGKTTVRIKGDYFRAGDLNRLEATYTNRNLDYVIRHCVVSGETTPSGTMAYAVGRNTIYRLKIFRIFSDGERVYVKWYYDSDNDGDYNDCTDGAPFYENIQLSDGETPND